MYKQNKIIEILTILILLGVICFIMFGVSLKSSDINNKIPIGILKVKSNSMYPAFEVDDCVIIKKIKRYKVGDIITYNYRNKYLITHRIVKIENGYYFTKGDFNNCSDDEKVSQKDIRGKVILILTKKCRILLYFIIFCVFFIIITIKGVLNK